MAAVGAVCRTAVELGLKVDVEALPQDLIAKIKAGEVHLEDPATTLALLKLNAVIGVQGVVAGDNTLKSVGITCCSVTQRSTIRSLGHRQTPGRLAAAVTCASAA